MMTFLSGVHWKHRLIWRDELEVQGACVEIFYDTQVTVAVCKTVVAENMNSET